MSFEILLALATFGSGAVVSAIAKSNYFVKATRALEKLTQATKLKRLNYTRSGTTEKVQLDRIRKLDTTFSSSPTKKLSHFNLTIRREFEQDLIFKISNDIKVHPLRIEYESKVEALAQYKTEYEMMMRSYNENIIDHIAKLEDAEKALAFKAHLARRELGAEYKNITPKALREYIYEVNMGRYGDPLGPSVYLLIERGKTYKEIIWSSSKPNPDVNKLLSGFNKWLESKPDSYIKTLMDE
ncbi:hypothetical protein [Pseudoalteromonas sp. HM-SA03]|uniref:hypothetical protein n=1 Tax=Pseudoalteromonas sp. HM-SA03 TaxID=2029678 RepID=UPI0020D11971|nr:hypothetical protein [Pseudoalteromonas sp. HM-SA03]